MDTSDFYARLAPFGSFAAITDPRNFTPLPDDWQLVITDVRGSTRAIAEGRYKEVNMVGAASIVALLNLARPIDIPFVFGGDGATLAIPPGLVQSARRTLAALGALARQSFGLDLRCALVPVAALTAAGQAIRLARIAIAEHYAQAAFSGGLAYAEALVKDPIDGEVYLIEPSDSPDSADLTGLECRWQDIRSRHGETVSLLVAPAPGLPAPARPALLRELIAQIETVYGSERDYHPLALAQLQVSADPRSLLVETRARTAPALWPRLSYLARIWTTNIGVQIFRGYERLLGRMPWWDQYRDLVFQTADYRKFDDTLRMIIAGTPAQRQQLEAYLEERFRRGELAYGIHVADRALMTCLVFERLGRQVHFVDGADGGYALAARALKGRLAELGTLLRPGDPETRST